MIFNVKFGIFINDIQYQFWIILDYIVVSLFMKMISMGILTIHDIQWMIFTNDIMVYHVLLALSLSYYFYRCDVNDND